MGGFLHGRCCGSVPPTYSFHQANYLQYFGNKFADPLEAVVPLIGASAEVKVIDYCAEVEIKQRYENREESPVEAVYEFPLNANAAVCRFWAEIDGKQIIGKSE